MGLLDVHQCLPLPGGETLAGCEHPLLFAKDLPHDALGGPPVELGIPDRLIEDYQLPLLQIRDDVVGVVGSRSARMLVAQGLERENTIRCAEDAEDGLQSRIRPLFPGI